MIKNTIFLITILLIPSITLAHPGRTDSSGCHTCRTNCASWGLSTGEYHCHRSKGVPQPEEPIRSIRNENGVGTTVPAPEYKVPVNNTIKTQTSTNTTIAPTIKVIPKPIVKPASVIEAEEKSVISYTINEIPKPNPRPTPQVTETKKPNTIKRFFNWLFK